jgi:hypothetical protein
MTRCSQANRYFSAAPCPIRNYFSGQPLTWVQGRFLRGKTVRTDAGAAAIAGPFIAKAIASGIRAPARLIDQGTHGWLLVQRGGDVLIVDEFGDLWWTRRVLGSDYRVVRACWPEESATLIAEIRSAFERILA